MDGGGGGGNGSGRDRDGYFPAYTNGNGNGRTDVRVPRRAYSQSSGGRDRERLGPGTTDQFGYTSNGRQAISLNDPAYDPGPSNLERLPPSRVNSATYGRRHVSGVDLSQIPVRHSSGGDAASAHTNTSATATSTRGFMALFPWMRRSRPEPKRQTSDFVDQLSGEVRIIFLVRFRLDSEEVRETDRIM